MTSLEQERREILDTVFHTLSSRVPDADEMAVCAFLMQHLAAEPGPSTAQLLQSAPKVATRSLHVLRNAVRCSVS